MPEAGQERAAVGDVEALHGDRAGQKRGDLGAAVGGDDDFLSKVDKGAGGLRADHAQERRRRLLDDAARERLVTNIAGHLLNAVSEPVLQRAFQYWRNVDKSLGDKIEAAVRAKQDEKDPKAAEQANPARSSMQAKA